MFEARSALVSVMPASGRDGADGRRRLLLGEAPLGSLVQVGIYPGAAALVAGAAAAMLGGALPESTVSAARLGDHLAFRVAADQYWIRTPDTSLAGRLRARLARDAASVTPLDGARTCMLIGGPAARNLLGRLVAIDVDPSVFEIGHFAQAPIHHLSGLLYRAGPERYEFIALRTFAAYTWEVIEDAARFFGYDIASGGRA
jgi:heterotetrameric sarcosine oxidase gamma subunit